MVRIPERLENPWLVDQKRYDRQMQEPRTVCSVCGEHVSEYTEYPDGAVVCDECEADYLAKNEDGYLAEYIDGEEAHEYYCQWWFGSLDREAQEKIMKAAYEGAFRETPQQALLDKRQYVRQCCKYEFREYVKRRLLAG